MVTDITYVFRGKWLWNLGLRIEFIPRKALEDIGWFVGFAMYRPYVGGFSIMVFLYYYIGGSLRSGRSYDGSIIWFGCW